MLKKDLRYIFKQKRDQLAKETIQLLSKKIEILLLEFLAKQKFDSVNCFLSSVSKKEVQTNSIIQQLWTLNKQVSVPFSNYETLEIVAAEYLPNQNTFLDSFDIPSFTPSKMIDFSKIEIVISPLICFDLNGNRTGYGKGMYDRFLQKCNPNVIKIGLSFFEAIDEISDLNEFDIPLDYVISPKKVYVF